MENTAIIWMISYPFFGALLLGLIHLCGGSKTFARIAGGLASLVVILSFLKALPMAQVFLSDGTAPAFTASLGDWISVGSLRLGFDFRLDALSAIMALVVTFVSSLIHLYSIGYMGHDPDRVRYFSFLNLFVGFMLILVSADSLPLLFVGWEGVGLCSYLLIGFWYTDRAKAAAGKKAFIVNRIGDAGFMLGMVLAFRIFGTLQFSELAAHPGFALMARAPILELMALLFFVGCMGKSAQFPLYIWLPDAMAGPTPVSALIHAATMVTAGVYLLGRMSFLFHPDLVPYACHFVAWMGAITALFAATIALTQRDIKKVLAFSTVSQLGFMVVAMGLGVYWAGIFHLVTHAFFKALLFLGAGAVIHALHEEQDIFKMGGLKSYLVSTTLVFLAGYLAIIGFPFTSGYFSKDEIIYSALATGNSAIFWILVLAAALTAAYMTRLFALTFLGLPRMSRDKIQDLHESPKVMILPMAVLAFFSLFGGLFGVYPALKSFFGAVEHPGHTWLSHGQLGAAMGVLSIGIAVLTVKLMTTWREGFSKKIKSLEGVNGLLQRQYRFDDFMMLLGGPLTRFMAILTRLFDVYIIDGFLNNCAQGAKELAGSLSRIQTGIAQGYMLAMVLGTMLIAWLFVFGGGQ